MLLTAVPATTLLRAVLTWVQGLGYVAEVWHFCSAVTWPCTGFVHCKSFGRNSESRLHMSSAHA